MTESINDEGVCRTAPATSGLLVIHLKNALGMKKKNIKK